MFGKKHPVELTPVEADHGARHRKLTLVDVRLPEERARLAPAAPHIHITFRELRARLSEIPTDRPVAFVCRTGLLGGKAAKRARAAGLDAHNVSGGMVWWDEGGLPVTTGEQPAAEPGPAADAPPSAE